MRKLLAIAIVLGASACRCRRSLQSKLSALLIRSGSTSPRPARSAIENSFGEVDIDGWDRPEVEVTVVRSTEHLYDAKQRTEAQRRLDSVQVTAKQNGNDVVISTAYPPRNGFLHPLSRRSDIEISLPHPGAARLETDHRSQ